MSESQKSLPSVAPQPPAPTPAAPSPAEQSVSSKPLSADPAAPVPPVPAPAAPARKPEIGGPKGPEPTRYGDWERAGRCVDF
jgi:hypothetical protein